MSLQAIAAMAANRVIGDGNRLPWRLPEDLARFKRLTMGGILILGRKTYESIGRPLPGRKMVVVSRQPGYAPEGVLVVRSIEEALERAGEGNVWIAGGAEIYRQALGKAERLYLTRIEAEVPGDAFFPEIDPGAWQLVEEERRGAGAEFPYPYRFEVWERQLLARPIEYPESDGRPMAETQAHGQVLLDLYHALSQRYAEVPDVYVWFNMLLYFVQGDPRACVAPDVFLVRGVDKRERRTYKVWEEGWAPSLVCEVTSKSTRDEDVVTKKEVYERLGVEEYFLFDPLGEYLRPSLQGYRLVGGRYQGLAPQRGGSLESRTTGLRFVVEGKRLRLRDAETDEPLPWQEENVTARRAAEREAEQQTSIAEEERRARAVAEQRARALEEELARLHRGF